MLRRRWLGTSAAVFPLVKPASLPFPVARRLPGALILLVFFAVALLASAQQGPTFDEQGFLTRGIGYMRGENRIMRVGHPLGLNALNAALLAGDPAVRLPLDDPSWQERSFHRPSELFLWEIGNDVEKVLFLGRLPTIWLGMLLVAVAGRWAWEVSRRDAAGWLALALVGLDPNILAHSQLATTDLGLAAAATLAGFTLWRFLRTPSWMRVLIAGAALGLLQNTKFTAGLFVPLFALVVAAALPWWWQRADRSHRWRLAAMLGAYPLVGVVTLWALYGFDVGMLPDSLPVLPQLAGRTVPLAHHLEQLLDIGGRMQKRTPAFLLGSYSDSGWWTYFPVTFLLKTPLPTLFVMGWALSRSVWGALKEGLQLSRRGLVDYAALLVPPLGYFAIALTTDINLGYRHLLPVLPFLLVFSAISLLGAARGAGQAEDTRRNTGPLVVVIVAVLMLFVATVRVYPHFLAYFNVIAGGPENGWRYLVDSNIDWGQDLPALRAWMDEHEVEHVWLSYFGEGRPEYYGISYTGLDSYPPRLMDAGARPFYPRDPAPGVYAISVTTLQGVHFENHDLYAWFREREPVDAVGYSILIYEVEPYGAPVELALGAIQLDEIDPSQYTLLATNRVTPHWFDPASAWLMPAAGASGARWLVVDRQASVAPWEALLNVHYELEHEDEQSVLWRQVLAPALAAEPLATLERGESVFELVDVDGVQGTTQPGGWLTLRSRWQQLGEPAPVKMFIHVADSAGRIVTQWDGLGAAWQGWRRGDLLWQQHQLELPPDVAPGVYDMWAGLYEPESGERWRMGDADRVFLGAVTVEDGH